MGIKPSRSRVHRDESLVSRTFEPLKRMYEQLSNGVTFQRGDQIEQKHALDYPCRVLSRNNGDEFLALPSSACSDIDSRVVDFADLMVGFSVVWTRRVTGVGAVRPSMYQIFSEGRSMCVHRRHTLTTDAYGSRRSDGSRRPGGSGRCRRSGKNGSGTASTRARRGP